MASRRWPSTSLLAAGLERIQPHSHTPSAWPGGPKWPSRGICTAVDPDAQTG